MFAGCCSDGTTSCGSNADCPDIPNCSGGGNCNGVCNDQDGPGCGVPPPPPTGGGPAPTACFLPGTEVRMSSGGVKKIEDIKVGDKVKSFSDKGGDEVVESTVSQIFERTRDFYYSLVAEGYKVKASAEHPFYVGNGEYKTISELKRGDIVYILKNNSLVKKIVSSNTRVDESTPVYNMSVDKTNTYFAGGFAVHNKGNPPVCYHGEVDCPAGTTRGSRVISTFCWYDDPNGQCRLGSAQQITGCCRMITIDKERVCVNNQGTTYNCVPICTETETCVPKCGQAKVCGGSCANTDNGTSPVVSIVSPNGSAASPTIIADTTPLLRWGALPASGKADRYFLQVLDSGGTVVWSRYVQAIGTSGVSTGIALGAGVYHWRIRGENTSCGIDASPWSTSGYMKLSSVPTVSCLLLKNANGTVVPWESGNQNHIMNPAFVNTAFPKRVTFQACVTDPDGFVDVQSAKMECNGMTYNMALGAGSGTGVTATVTVNFTSADNSDTACPILVDVKDVATQNDPVIWTDTGYKFKVWEGNVVVSGTVYDSSDSALGAQCPSGVGYSTPAGAGMNFRYVDFTPTVGSFVRINANSDSTYIGGLVNWGKTYSVIPNSDFIGGTVRSRWVDVGVGTTSCGSQLSLNNSVVNPYMTSPTLRVDIASALGQPGWFQVVNGGIQAAGSVLTLVPATCGQDANCVGAIAKTNNSLISGSTISNGGCVLGQANCQYGNPNNWYKNISTLSSAEKFDYRYYYDKYFLGNGGGTTLPADSTMTMVKARGGVGVFFVNGDFSINEDNTLNSGQSLMVIVKGKIDFSQGVNRSDGIFVADGGMTLGGASATQLTINGSLYSANSGGDIIFSRQYSNDLDNNISPAIVVNYRPDLVFNLPGSFLKVLSGWRQN